MKYILFTMLAALIIGQSFHVQWTIERYTVLARGRQWQSWSFAIVLSSLAFICVYLKIEWLAVLFTVFEMVINYFYVDRKSIPAMYKRRYKNYSADKMREFKRKEWMGYFIYLFIPACIYIVGRVYVQLP